MSTKPFARNSRSWLETCVQLGGSLSELDVMDFRYQREAWCQLDLVSPELDVALGRPEMRLLKNERTLML